MIEKKKKIKHNSARHQWLLVEKSDDESTLTIANQDGAVEFNASTASAGVNSLNNLQGNITIASPDGSINIGYGEQTINLTTTGGSGQPTIISSTDSNIIINQSSYNASLTLNSSITGITSINDIVNGGRILFGDQNAPYIEMTTSFSGMSADFNIQ